VTGGFGKKIYLLSWKGKTKSGSESNKASEIKEMKNNSELEINPVHIACGNHIGCKVENEDGTGI